MPTITWTETLPSNASAVGRSPSEIRQHIISTAQGLGAWLEWPGSGGGSELSPGDPKAGAARPYFAPASQHSLASPQQLFLTSDTTRLLFTTSAGTVQAGTVRLLEHDTTAGGDMWVMQSGTTVIPQANNSVITFATAFSDAPSVVATSTYIGVTFAILAVSAQTFSITARRFGGSDATTLTWLALGKVRF